MKFLLVSDLHYALKQFDWAAAVASGFDVIVLAGDHLDIASPLDGSVQILVILKYLKLMSGRARVIVCSGNHDLDFRDGNGEKVARWMERVRQLGIATDGDSIALGDTLVTICPWWDGASVKQAVLNQIERDAARAKEKWVWIYHAPPLGSPTSWDGHRFYGDAELKVWIETYKPDIVFTGHIHQAPFRKGGSWVDRIGPTWVFNCGQQIGPTPTHIAVDTDAREAAWFSLAGAELIKLDLPLQRPLLPLTAPPAWLASASRDPGRSPA
jgi:Icc-related predicted phosphoesterase